MSSSVGSILGSAISTAGQLYANSQSLANQDKWNYISMAQANTAHQREVADLEASGLNPILSATGNGASTGSFGTLSFQNPASSASSAGEAWDKYHNDLVHAQLGIAKDEARIVGANANSAEAESKALQAEAELSLLQTETYREALLREQGQSRTYRKDGSLSTEWNEKAYDAYINLMREGIRSDMKVNANSNWRANLSSFLPFMSPIVGNSAKGLGTGSQMLMRKLIK